MPPLSIPEPFEFLEFFEKLPCEEEPRDGLWCYELTSQEWKLLFCFNVLERWLKTQITIRDHVIEEVVHEGLTRIWIEQRPQGRALVGECDGGQVRSRLEILVQPTLLARWSILVGIA